MNKGEQRTARKPRGVGKLSDAKLKSLKPKDKTYQVSDERGLYVDVMPDGARVFRYRYQLGGKRGRLTIGTYPDTPLRKARKALDAARALVASGKSPVQARREAKHQAADTEATVGGFAPRFISEYLELQKRPAVNQRRLERHLLPTLRNRRWEDVTRADLLAITDGLKAKGRTQEARHVLILARTLFAHAIVRQRLDRNPAKDIPLKLIGPPGERDRALSKDELRKFYSALAAATFLSPVYAHAFHLLLFTLCRKGELVRARWDNVDLEGATWTVPKADQKIGIPHVVPLSRQAVAHFQALKALAGKSPHVLASLDGRKEKPLAESSLNWALYQLLRKRGDEPALLNIPAFTLHDFRRTASTLLHGKGFQMEWVEKALGHKVGGVHGIYNKAAYLPERRDMLQRWADELDALEHGAKVVHIPRRA